MTFEYLDIQLTRYTGDMFYMNKVVVIDALCGQGKTESIIDMMQKDVSGKFLYVTPYLSECHRVAGTSYDVEDEYKKPLLDVEGNYLYDEQARLIDFKFKHPDDSFGRKGKSLCSLLSEGENVVSTHALFTELGSNAIEAAKDYTLIIDESVNVYTQDSRHKTISDAMAKKIIYLDEDGITLRFDRSMFGEATEEHPDTAKGSLYESIAAQCDLGQLLLIKKKAVVWEMSADLLRTFKSVIICTYMFEGSEMSVYLKKKGINYSVQKLTGAKTAKDVSHLIEVLDDSKLNAVGATGKLSSSAFAHKDKKEVLCETMRRNLQNVFTNKWKAKANDRLWTCFVINKKVIGGEKYLNQFLSYNYKATNDYMNVHHVAFLIDVHTNPNIVEASEINSNSLMDQELYAVSSLIQFIFRSAVRKGEPIKLYLPSLRMRELLERWKNGEFDE